MIQNVPYVIEPQDKNGKNSIRDGTAPGVSVSYHPHKPMPEQTCLAVPDEFKRDLSEPRNRYKDFIKVLKGM